MTHSSEKKHKSEVASVEVSTNKGDSITENGTSDLLHLIQEKDSYEEVRELMV
jgi:hypothetical protein